MGVICNCDGWHDWNCPNTTCSEHPECKLFKELDKED